MGDQSTRRRVKLYALNAERQWDDRGTGHVTSSYVEKLQGECRRGTVVPLIVTFGRPKRHCAVDRWIWGEMC